MGNNYYMQIEPNSHFWTDLEQLVHCIQFDNNWYATNAERKEGTIDMHEPLTREYVLIGIKNSLKNGYDLRFNYNNLTEVPIEIHFNTTQEIIDYLEIQDWNINEFLNMIQHTINNGYNLTNNVKMEREEVYKRIDTEREYQDLRWSPRREKNDTPDEEKPPAEWINYIEYHISAAKNAVYLLEDKNALAEVRKIAALAIRCLELHGCPERVIPDDLK